MTQSGRCYALAMGKTAPLKPTKGILKQKEAKVVTDAINELVTKEEASEFLKFIKHNEYNVVE